MIFESNDDIKNLISYLDSKVLELKSKHPRSVLLKQTSTFYKRIIIPWMEEFQLANIEVGDQKDEYLKNKILDLINILDAALKK